MNWPNARTPVIRSVDRTSTIDQLKHGRIVLPIPTGKSCASMLTHRRQKNRGINTANVVMARAHHHGITPTGFSHKDARRDREQQNKKEYDHRRAAISQRVSDRPKSTLLHMSAACLTSAKPITKNQEDGVNGF